MILKGGKILEGRVLVPRDILISDGRIKKIGNALDFKNEEVLNLAGGWIIPGATDVHVHLREPGYTHKETVYSGTRSAAKGGITSLMAMPNLMPVPDSLENLEAELAAIEKGAAVKVYPYAALTEGQKGLKLSDIDGLSKLILAFSDDGFGVNDKPLLEEAMRKVKKNNRIIASHAERAGLGVSRESEITAVREEIELLKKTGCKYHFCHLSTEESFELVRRAKRDGLDVTAEVTPHHLFLNEAMINGSTAFKMNPPLRREEDRLATVAALLDKTAGIVATDHAPHSAEEKSLPYEKAPNGIIGLESMLPLLFTKLVRTGLAEYQDLINWTSVNPNARFGIPNSAIAANEAADITVLDIENEKLFSAERLLSKGKNSPFIGEKFFGMPILTLIGGRIVYSEI